MTPEERAKRIVDKFEHVGSLYILEEEILHAILGTIAAEREACAEVAEDAVNPVYPGAPSSMTANRIAAAIRARGEE